MADQFLLAGLQPIPRDMYEAARMDGAGSLRIFLQIVLPLSRPILGTVAIYGFLSTYNQYFWPLLVTNEPMMRTTQVGIAQLRFEEAQRWGLEESVAVLSPGQTIRW